MTAGMTFLGQFLDHDMTLDITSSLEQQVDPEMIRNFRMPAFELDSVYGQGPARLAAPVRPERRRRPDQAAGRAESRDRRRWRATACMKFDLPRNSQGTPLIGDPRNDENLVLSQLQVAFLRFHNARGRPRRAPTPA